MHLIYVYIHEGPTAHIRKYAYELRPLQDVCWIFIWIN